MKYVHNSAMALAPEKTLASYSGVGVKSLLYSGVAMNAAFRRFCSRWFYTRVMNSKFSNNTQPFMNCVMQ